MSRHLAALPAERPTPVGFPVTIEIPTGGRDDVDGLIRELAKVAFRGVLTGFEAFQDGPRVRVVLKVQPLTTFGAEEVERGRNRIIAALIDAGVLKQKPKAAPEPDGSGGGEPVPKPASSTTTEADPACPSSSPAS